MFETGGDTIVETKLRTTVFHRHSFKEDSISIDQDKVERSKTIITGENFHTAWREAHLWIAKERIKKCCKEVVHLDKSQLVSTDYCSHEIREISDETNAA